MKQRKREGKRIAATFKSITFQEYTLNIEVKLMKCWNGLKKLKIFLAFIIKSPSGKFLLLMRRKLPGILFLTG